MTRPFEFVPSNELDPQLLDYADDVLADMSPEGQALEMAANDLDGASLQFNTLLVRMTEGDPGTEDDFNERMEDLTSAFWTLTDEIAPEDFKDETIEHARALATIVATQTYDRGLLLQEITGVDLFVNLTPTQMMEGVMDTLSESKNDPIYSGMSMVAADAFEVLLHDQLRHLGSVLSQPAPATASFGVNVARWLGYHLPRPFRRRS